MARPESAAVAHFIPTPPRLAPWIGRLAQLDEPSPRPPDGERSTFRSSVGGKRRALAIVDPCAGTGEPVLAIARAVYGDLRDAPVDFFVVELEATRVAALQRTLEDAHVSPRTQPVVTQGDAFGLAWARAEAREGASLLFLNPPYDDDREHVRLEQKWLLRFAPMLCVGGVMLFVVPASSLPVCAATLATHFEKLACFRFPDPEFAGYGQVVVVGTKIAPLLRPSPAVVAQLAACAAAPAELPTLGPDVAPVATVPSFLECDFRAGFSRWELEPMDLTAILRAFTPWRRTDRRGNEVVISGVVPDGGAESMKALKVETAQPLHAGYVAPALACNLFDGIRLEPDDPASGLGPILLKAVFRRTWVAVETRTNEKGMKIGQREREKPRLVVTALDLRTGTYHRLQSSVERTAATSLGTMTAADLLAHYSRALLATLRAQCPALHDPSNPDHDRVIPELEPPLFRAQRDAVITVVKLLELYGAALIDGETGVGKTRMAIATMRARGARRVLIVCPPHLVQDPWGDEVAAVWPGARTMILTDVTEVDAFAADRDPRPLVAILSETSGKLCHGWAGIGETDHAADPRHVGDTLAFGREVGPHRAAFLTSWTRSARALALAATGALLPIARCPRCGAITPAAPAVLARARSAEGAGRCGHRVPTPHPSLPAEGAIALSLAEALLPIFPSDARVRELCPTPGKARLATLWAARPEGRRITRAWAALIAGRRLHAIAWRMSEPHRVGKPALTESALGRLLVAIADDKLTAAIVRAIYAAPAPADAFDPTTDAGVVEARALERRDMARRLMLTMQPCGEEQATLAVELFALAPEDGHLWLRFAAKVATLAGVRPLWDRYADMHCADQARRDGLSSLHYGFRRGDPAAALAALEKSFPRSGLALGKPCGELLYQAVPNPRRVPLSAYLAKRHPGLVDLVIIDEVHECGDQDSAQSAAMAQWSGTPMIGLTGSLSNGYAASLFFILHTMSPAFRAEFQRTELQAFISKYGFRNQWVEYRDKASREIVAFGSNSDRVERKVKGLSDAPGTLPSLTVRHLLKISVVVHLEDLNIELPPCTEVVKMIDPGPVLGPLVRRARETLLQQIKRDRYSTHAGALFGAMGNEWGSADLAGVGNCDDGVYRLAYPASAGGSTVAELSVPLDLVLPKEQAMLDEVREQLAAGRNVLIFAWHAATPLYERLASLVREHLGEPCIILDSKKVKAVKRDEWIRKEIIGKRRRVLIANPAAVGTGFNKLTWFSTVVWFQPPACNPKDDRQAMGRIRRPGQTKAQRVVRLIYAGTSQELVHTLLLWKVAASRAIDGLDDTAALHAAGVEMNEEMSGFALGHQLYRMALRESGENVDGN